MIERGGVDHGGVWLDVVSAVDYLAETHRPAFTVWDALDEAIRWWINELLEPRNGFPPHRRVELLWHDPDPLRSTIEVLLGAVAPAGSADSPGMADAFMAALTAWLSVMAEDFNDGHAFGPPEPRRDARI